MYIYTTYYVATLRILPVLWISIYTQQTRQEADRREMTAEGEEKIIIHEENYGNFD